MDDQLRAAPQDPTALLRAGRLDPLRIAVAGFLGSQPALATGVAPWEPDSDDLPPAQAVIASPRLDRRWRVWLACELAEGAVDAFGPDATQHDPAREALRAARSWCRGQVSADAVRDAAYALARAEYGPNTNVVESAFAATIGVVNEQALRRVAEWSAWAGAQLPSGVRSERLFAAEQARQSAALAEVLLDPTWPPWGGAPA